MDTISTGRIRKVQDGHGTYITGTVSPWSMTCGNTRLPPFDPLLSCLLFHAAPNNQTHNHPDRQTQNTWPGGMRARAMNDSSAAPLGGRSVLNRNRELTDSKASAASAHSVGPVPKYRLFYFGASIFRIFQIFGPFFFCFKKTLNFGSAQNAQKYLKSDLGSFLAPILVAFRIPFGTNFLNIS